MKSPPIVRLCDAYFFSMRLNLRQSVASSASSSTASNKAADRAAAFKRGTIVISSDEEDELDNEDDEPDEVVGITKA